MHAEGPTRITKWTTISIDYIVSDFLWFDVYVEIVILGLPDYKAVFSSFS